MDVAVGRLPLGHLQGRYAQAPDVGHAVVANLLDNFRGHPEGSSYNNTDNFYLDLHSTVPTE